MDPVAKAAWYIEHSFGRGIALGDVAAAGGVSPYHLLRSFAAVTGRPVMRHVRARRLSEAAKALANGADSVLAVAIDTGYGPHEAFTRAFRQQFGVAPESVRAHGLAELQLVEALRWTRPCSTPLPNRGSKLRGRRAWPASPPASTRRRAPTSPRYGSDSKRSTPPSPSRSTRRCVTASATVFDGEGGFDYLCGLEVAPSADVPNAMATVRIPARGYAVFTHEGHISTIRRTWMTIFGKWFATSGYESDHAPEFERYDRRFDPATGNGAVEIWIPVKPKA